MSSGTGCRQMAIDPIIMIEIKLKLAKMFLNGSICPRKKDLTVQHLESTEVMQDMASGSIVRVNQHTRNEITASGSIVLVSDPQKQDVMKFISFKVTEDDIVPAREATNNCPSIPIPSQMYEVSDARRFVLPKLIHPEQDTSSKKSDLSMFEKNQQGEDVQDRLDSIHEVSPLLIMYVIQTSMPAI
jgi:hypothetical protein